MRTICLIFLIKLAYSSAALSDYLKDAGALSDEEYKQLPKKFHIDNYAECIANEENSFCRLTIALSESKSNNNSQMWKIIEKTTVSPKYFAYDELLHAVCFKNKDLRGSAEEYAEKLKLGDDVDVKVASIDCNHNDQSLFKIRGVDLAFLFCLILYVAVTLFATFSDQAQLGRLTRPLSVKANWSKLKKMYENIDNNSQLKSIQGLRFYTMVLIILCHTYLSYNGSFLRDTKYVEDFAENSMRYGLIIVFVFLVQSFFLISGLLLAWNSFKIFQRDPEISAVRYFWVSAINRYLRLFPVIMVEVGLVSTVWVHFLFSGPLKSLYADREFVTCQKMWWASLLFISNLYNSNDMCFKIGWYLAADFQLYLFSLVVLVVLWKHQNRVKSILFAIIASGVVGHGLVVYWNDFDIVFRLLPKNLNVDAFGTLEQSVVYSSTYANLPTYMLGLGFGIALFKFNEKPFLTPNKHNNALWAGFVTIPLFVLFAASFSYGSVMTGIVASTVKPLLALGLGIGIFGMSQGVIKGLVRRVFEWKPVVFLGNITYSTYVVHYPLVFCRTVVVQQPLPVSDTILVTAFVQDFIVSFSCGFLMYLLVEMPWLQLQTMFVPKLGRSVRKDKKSVKSS